MERLGLIMDIDINYWIQNVNLPQVRGMLILSFLDLSDKEYLEVIWFNPYHNYSFYSNITMIREIIFDEMNVKLDEEIIPYDPDHYVLKSDKEAEILFKVAQKLNKLHYSVENETNEEYLNSSLYPQLIEVSKEAFDIFMESEKDNKKFIRFIEEVKSNMKKKIEEKKASAVQ